MPIKTFSDTWPVCPKGNCDQGRDCDCGEAASACTEIGADQDDLAIWRGLVNALAIEAAFFILGFIAGLGWRFIFH